MSVCFCTGKCFQLCPKCGNRQGCTGNCQCSPAHFNTWTQPNTLFYLPPDPNKKGGPPYPPDDDIRWYSVQDEEETPMVPSLKDEVKDNKKVNFKFYRGQNLWYETESGFMFPVPVEDIGEATFLAQDKAILFMRYIRKYIEECKNDREI